MGSQRAYTDWGAMISDIQNLAVRYGQMWARHDLDGIIALHTDDTVFHIHGDTPAVTGAAATRAAFAAILHRTPDLRFERKQVFFSDTRFVIEYEMSGTAEGLHFVCDGIDVITVESSRVARKDSYLDWVALQRQLNNQPAAAQASLAEITT